MNAKKHRKLEIKINTLEEAGKEFVKTWHEAKIPHKKVKTKEVLTFNNLRTLLKVLTPTRLTLLKELSSYGPTSVRKLSQLLNRAYTNVHADIRLLSDCGLIAKREDKNYVPWTEIVAVLNLQDAHKSSVELEHKKAS